MLFVGILTGNLASPPIEGVPIVPSPAGSGVTMNFTGTATLKSELYNRTYPIVGWLAVIVPFLHVLAHTSMICSAPFIVKAVPASSPAVVLVVLMVPHFLNCCLPVLTELTTIDTPAYGATVLDCRAVP